VRRAISEQGGGGLHYELLCAPATLRDSSVMQVSGKCGGCKRPLKRLARQMELFCKVDAIIHLQAAASKLIRDQQSR